MSLLLTLVSFFMQYQGKSLDVHLESFLEGLPQVTVTSIIRDPHGFLWVGTQSGLARFDGYEYRIYSHDPENSETLGHPLVSKLIIDLQGRLWVGVLGGVNRFNEQLGTFTHFALPENDRVEDMVAFQDGDLLVSTSGGLFKFDGQSSSSTVENLIDHPTRQMVQHNGKVWVLSPDQIMVYADGKVSTLFESPGSGFQSIAMDHLNRLWIGGKRGGLWTFDTTENELSQVIDPNKFAEKAITQITPDDQGRLWVGSRTGLGVLNPEDGRCSSVRVNAELSGEINIETMFFEPGGSLWLGLHDKGLQRLDLNALLLGTVRLSGRENISASTVETFDLDSNGILWFGTPSGIRSYDQETGAIDSLPKDAMQVLEDSILIAFLFDRSDRIWAGTYQKGLLRMEPNGSWREMDLRKPEDGHPAVYHLLERQNGQIWTAMLNKGAHSVSMDDEIRAYVADNAEPNALPEGYLLQLFEDSRQNLWFASYGGGLCHYTDELDRFSRFTRKNHGLISDEVIAITEANDGSLWVGTVSGLSKLERDANRFINFTKKDGLPADTVFNLITDSDNRVWMGTSQGLVCFDPLLNRWKHFGVAQGAQGNEYQTTSVMKLDNGKILMGGVNGFNLFNPQAITMDSMPPSVSLTGFLLYNKPITPSADGPLTAPAHLAKNLTLQYSQNMFSIEFAALETRFPGQTQYAYRMESFDTDWVLTNSKHRIATYTNLSPGTYQFKVKAANSDNVWTEPVGVEVVIHPPFWRTTLAFVFYGLLVVGLIGAYILYQRRRRKLLQNLVDERTQQLTAAQHELLDAAYNAGMDELAMDVLHNLGNRLNSVKTSAQTIRELVQKDQTITRLQRLSDRLLQDAKEIESENISRYLKQMALHLRAYHDQLDTETFQMDCKIQETCQALWRQQLRLNQANSKTEFDLDQLLRMVIEKHHLLIQNSGLKIHLPEQTPIMLVADRSRLSRVLTYILRNAIDATKTIGGNLFFQLEDQIDHVRLIFKDDGEGIHSDNLNLIFREGFTTRKDRPGHGLHYCANVIKEMNGHIQITSPGPGQGIEGEISLKK